MNKWGGIPYAASYLLLNFIEVKSVLLNRGSVAETLSQIRDLTPK
jgi:hypothetical protein